MGVGIISYIRHEITLSENWIGKGGKIQGFSQSMNPHLRIDRGGEAPEQIHLCPSLPDTGFCTMLKFSRRILVDNIISNANLK